MSSILSRDTEESRAKGKSDPLIRAVKVALEETESGGSSGSQDGRVVRPFLLVDIGAVLDYVRGKRGGATEAVANSVEETIKTQMSGGGR